MSKRICGRCRSTDIKENSLRGEVIWCNCNRCKYFAKVTDFPVQSVFDSITQSEERLADTYMFNHDGKVFKSLLLPHMVFSSREEAHAATVAKLKEVYQ